MNGKYQHIFFDLDHTLWDFEKNSAMALAELYHGHGLAARGVTDFEQFRAIYERNNEKFWDRLRRGLIRREDMRWKRFWHTLLEHGIADRALANAMSERYLEILPTLSALMPHAAEILDYCRQKGYRLHVITNGFEATQLQKMNASGIAHFFDKIITSEKSMSMKPKPGIFEYALLQTGATKANSLMIGDGLAIDVLGAREFGMDQVYFNPVGMAHHDRVTFEIKRLSELETIL
ncbi:MAG: YjjG family noncanonical pyrimidine nucleotidase [Edaphocola sp.]